MSAAITCTSCNRPLRVPESVLGQTVQCPLCLDEFVARADPAAEAAARAAEPPRRAAARQQPVATAVRADADADQAPLAPIIDDEPAALPPVLEPVPEPAAAPKAAPKRAFVFPVMVSRDPDRVLRGPMDGELTAEGLYLRKMRQPPAFAAAGARARYLGANRLLVTVEGREVELAVVKPWTSTYHLARDAADFLNGKGPFPNPRAYALPWYLYFIAALFIALPFAACPFGLITDGPLGVFLWIVIAAVLAGAALIFATQARLRPRARLIAAVCVLGFGALLPFLTIPVTPSYTVDAKLWAPYTPVNGDFTVVMPGSPQTMGAAQGGNISPKKYGIDVLSPEVEFVVFTWPAQGPFTGRPAVDQSVADAAKDLLTREYFPSEYAYPQREQSGSSHGLAYRELFIQIPSSSYYSYRTPHAGHGLAARVYVVNGEVVTLAAVGPRVKLDGPDVVKFFDSLQVKPPTAPKTPASPLGMNGLLAYWSFDQDQGAFFMDESGNNITGTSHNAQISADGKRGKAIRFNGFSSYFDFSDPPDFNFGAGQEFTFCGWLRTNAAQGTVLSSHNAGDLGPVISLVLEQGVPVARVRKDGAQMWTPLMLRGGKAINDGAWRHFALTRHGPNAALRLYIDGAPTGPEQAGGVAAGGSITTDLRTLGAYQSQVGVVLNPTTQVDVDEFCIFNRALNDGEIRRLAGAGGP